MTQPAPSLPRLTRRFTAAAGAYALAGGFLALVGWAADIPRLADWDGDGVVMQPNTGLAAVATGVALLLLAAGRRRAAAALGLAVAAIGAATLAEHASGTDLGIDPLLLFGRPWGRAGTLAPGRMGIPASASWVFVGAALLLSWRAGPGNAAVAALGLLVAAIGGLSVTGYLFGANPLYALPHLTSVALQTATVILAAGIGLVASVPDREPVRILLDPSGAGTLARLAAPAAAALPVALGYLLVRGHAAGLYDAAMGSALLVLLLTLALCAGLWWCAAAVRAGEAVVRRSERELADFFENATVGLHWVGPDGTILRANRAELDMLGYARGEYVGRHIAEFHADRGVIDDILRRLAGGEAVRDCEARMVCKDGSVKPVVIDSSVLWDGGRFVHTRCFTRDVTEQKRAEEAQRESEERFTRFMGHLPGLAWIKDARGCYIYANDAAVKAFAVPREKLYGRTDREVFPPSTAAQFEANDRRAREGGAGVQVIETLEHEGEELHHSLVSKFAIPVPGDGGPLVGGVAIDITDRLRAEEALREADRRKDEFLAVLAHELRNPLAPIRNSLQLIQLAGDDGVVLEQARGVMDRQLRQMVRLIDDLLDLSRISRGKLDLRREWTDLAAVLRNAVETSRPLVAAAGHELTVTVPPEPIGLDADPTRLAQVFSNLLNNAAKYTDRGGHIWLSAERRGVDAVVRVRDTGVGIPADMLDRVFEMFVQVDQSLEKRHGGLGIGLTLVRRLVEMHGGTVAARSDGPGAGSEFVVRIPVAASPRGPQPSGRNGDAAAPSAGRRLLVADDNEDAAESLAMLLRLAGNEVRTARDGVEAVEAAAAFRPDAALLDIGMPRLNGYEAARRIREQPWGQGVALIALTGWGQPDDKQRAKEAGFDHHLTKPIDPMTLQRLLSGLKATTT